MNSLFRLSIILFISLAASANVSGQEQPTKLQRDIKLNGKPHSEQIVINVEKGMTFLEIKLKGTIEAGEISLLVFNPEGEKVNNMCLKAGEGRRAKGVMVESYTDPEPGVWKVEVESDHAFGDVKYYVSQK